MGLDDLDFYGLGERGLVIVFVFAFIALGDLGVMGLECLGEFAADGHPFVGF